MRQTLIGGLVVFLFLLLAYFPSLNAPHSSVDDAILVKVPQVVSPVEFESLRSILKFGSNIDYYPVRDISYLLDSVLWNQSVLISRIHQLFIFVVGLVFAVLILLELGTPWALAASSVALWGIHPYHAETLMWLSARKDVLALTFGTAGVYYFIRGTRLDSTSRLVFALGLFILSLLSKASFTLLPFVGILGAVFDLNIFRAQKARYAVTAAVLVAVASALGQSWFYTHANNMQSSIPADERVLSSLIALGKMSLGWILPSVNVLDLDNFGEWTQLNRVYLPLGLLIWAIYLAALVLSVVGKNRGMVFFLALSAALYLPVSALVFPHRNFYSTRYLEPASLAVALFIAVSMESRWRKWTPGFIAGLLVVTGVSTLMEGRVWSSNLSVRNKALANQPSSISLRSHLFGELVNSSRGAEASTVAEQLERQCLQLSEPRSSDEPAFANCQTFFKYAYYVKRWQNNVAESDRYYQLLHRSSSMLKPVPKALTRLKTEHMLISGQIDPKQLEQWTSLDGWYLNPDYRMLHVVSRCLLNLDGATARLNSLIQTRLLKRSFAESYVNETLHTSLRSRVRSCLQM